MDELPLDVRGSEPPTRGPVVSLGSPRRAGLFIVAALVAVVVLGGFNRLTSIVGA